MKLSDRTCANAKPDLKPYKLSDGNGLYLHVMPNGSKLWRLKYYFHSHERIMSFGSYPLVPLAEAREKREFARKQVFDGIDPRVFKEEEKRKAKVASSNTFEAVARAWHADQKEKWTPQYGANVLHRLNQDMFSTIGQMPIATIKPLNVLGALKIVEARGANEIARRLLQVSRQIFGYAIIHGYIETNPASDIGQALKPYKKGHYRMLDFKDLPDFLKALETNDARLFAQTRLAVKLLLLTFVRTGELIKAQWNEFDLNSGTWEIPAERMKMKKPHLVPLSRQAVSALKELKLLCGNREYVFPNRVRPRTHMSNNTILKALELMGYKEKTTGHGFRALAMTTLIEKLRYQFDVVDRQLSHSPRGKVRAAYDRTQFVEDRTKMMQDWADFLDQLIIPEMKDITCDYASGLRGVQ